MGIKVQVKLYRESPYGNSYGFHIMLEDKCVAIGAHLYNSHEEAEKEGDLLLSTFKGLL